MKKNGLFLAILGMLLVFGMSVIGCASVKPTVTQSLYQNLLGADIKNGKDGPETFGAFRFYISQDVVLTQVGADEYSADKRATVVKVRGKTNIVNLKNSTPGRVQNTPTPEKLEIGFEKLKDGTIPVFTFVQKPENGNDRYYFEQDSNGYISYGGADYTVTYKNPSEEPYLLYVEDAKREVKERKMKGLK